MNPIAHATQPPHPSRYAKPVEVSKRIRWDIDKDVIRGRVFDFNKKFLPDGLSMVNRIGFLDATERRLLSQIQGRSYANIFGLVERFIAAKALEISRDHWLGDQAALEALIRFSDEELKHQELFRRIEGMMAAGMPEGYTFPHEPNAVASFVLGKSTWAVLALTCHIEFFTQTHYLESIEADSNLSELWKDVFRYHWKEESQHAILDELEWVREDAKLTPEQREQGVTELIELVGAVDEILQAQAKEYFVRICGRKLPDREAASLEDAVLKAYRFQYIVSGVQAPRFNRALGALINNAQLERIAAALAPIVPHAGSSIEPLEALAS
jgi:hypothetical protein